MKDAFVVKKKRNFDVIKMHGTTIKKPLLTTVSEFINFF